MEDHNKQVKYYGVWPSDLLQDNEVENRFTWLLEHLAKSNRLNLSRATCPWAVSSVEDGRFYIGDARHFNVSLHDISTIIENMCREYQQYGPFSPPEKHPATLTVLLPDTLSGEMIVDVLDSYRPRLTPQGLMLGALDPVNELKSLTGGMGFPYRAPWNYFTIRWMVPGDHIFLNRNPAYREYYIKFFGSWPES